MIPLLSPGAAGCQHNNFHANSIALCILHLRGFGFANSTVHEECRRVCSVDVILIAIPTWEHIAYLKLSAMVVLCIRSLVNLTLP